MPDAGCQMLAVYRRSRFQHPASSIQQRIYERFRHSNLLRLSAFGFWLSFSEQR